MRPICILIFAILFSIFNAYAQKGVVTGGVYDPILEEGMADAVVTLMDAAGNTIDTLTTHYETELSTEANTDSGKMYIYKEKKNVPTRFRFGVNGEGVYMLKVEKIGYKTVEQKVDVKFSGRENVYDCGDIWLVKAARQLNEVTVTGTQLKFVWKGDTLVYNAAALQTADGDMLGELVQKLPGAKIENGKIYVNGRYVENLYINGKDFFNGDIGAALRSLPAFTVNKIEVYDEEGEMSRTTGIDMQDKMFTMNVKLKRQYKKTWTGTLTMKGGTDGRYGLFGSLMRMDDRQAFTVLGELNNINEHTDVLNSGYKSEQGEREGIHYYRGAFVNYHFEPNKNLKFGVTANVKNLHDYSTEHTATETYMLGGNTFGRTSDKGKNVSTSTGANANITYRPAKGYMLKGNYDFSYSRNHQDNMSRSASYLRNPDEIFRTHALDSTFAEPTESERLKNYVQTLLAQQSTARGHSVNHAATLEGQKAFGMDLLSVKGTITQNNSGYRSFNLYDLRYPIAEGSDYRHRYYSNPTHGTDGTAGVKYVLKYAANDSVNGQITFFYDFSQKYNYTNNPLYRLDWIETDGDSKDYALTWLPSATEALLSSLDKANSYTSGMHDTRHGVGIRWEHDFRLQNGTWLKFEGKLPFNHRFARMNYERNETSYYVSRVGRSFDPSVSMKWRYKKRDRNGLYGSVGLSYGLSHDLPSLMYLLPITDESNPLSILEGNDELKNVRQHTARLDLSRNIPEKRISLYTYFTATSIQNAVAMQYTYDATTGVNHSKPVNVNGNYQLHWGHQHQIYFDKKQKWSFSLSPSWDYTHSRDLNRWASSSNNSSDMNTVRTSSVDFLPGLVYYYKGTFVMLEVGPEWKHITGSRPDFETINARQMVSRVEINLMKLPLGFKFYTTASLTTRYGYSDNALNDTRLLWNTTLSRKFKKGFSLSFTANDILHQNDRIVTTLNSQGRTERYVRMLPSYYLVGVTWDWSKVQGDKRRK